MSVPFTHQIANISNFGAFEMLTIYLKKNKGYTEIILHFIKKRCFFIRITNCFFFSSLILF